MARLFGRDHEVKALRRLLDGAARGRAEWVIVAGEAGIGKSRLVDEIGRLAGEQGLVVVRAEALEGEQAPFALWSRVRPPLRATTTGDRPGLDGEDLRWSVVDDVRSAVAGLGPALLILEDLHWADSSSIWSLERL